MARFGPELFIVWVHGDRLVTPGPGWLKGHSIRVLRIWGSVKAFPQKYRLISMASWVEWEVGQDGASLPLHFQSYKISECCHFRFVWGLRDSYPNPSVQPQSL